MKASTFFATLVLVLLPLGQAMGAGIDQTEDVSGKTVFSFLEGAVKFVVIPDAGSGNVTVNFNEMNPNQGGPGSPKTLLNSINLPATCIPRTGSGKCPVFTATVNSGSLTGPFTVLIFYITDNPFALNPRLCAFEAAGDGDCDDLIGYFPLVPDTNDDGGLARNRDDLSIWFAATLAISATDPGVATILDPVGNNTTMADPHLANGGSNVPLKVQLCRAGHVGCLPIAGAQILVSIARFEPDFEIVLPLDFPGASTPPPFMEFIELSGWYQFNWKVPETPGLYMVTFIFLTNNSNTLTAWIRVPTP